MQAEVGESDEAYNKEIEYMNTNAQAFKHHNISKLTYHNKMQGILTLAEDIRTRNTAQTLTIRSDYRKPLGMWHALGCGKPCILREMANFPAMFGRFTGRVFSNM